MAKRRRNSLPKPVLDRKLQVNGAVTDLRTFLAQVFYRTETNTFPNIQPISSNQAREVIDLEPGQSVTIEALEILRVK